MSFVTPPFVALVAITFVLHWLVPRSWRSALLLVASYVFYAWAFPIHAVLLVAITLGAWVIDRRLDQASNRRALTRLGVAGVLLMLGVFKYSGMAIFTVSALFGRLGIPTLDVPPIAAPLGISYVTFGLVHYLVERSRGNVRRLSLTDFALFVAFFPTIVAGPIKRVDTFAEDLAERRRMPDAGEVAYALARITVGLAKKLVVADTLAALVPPLREAAGQHPFTLLVAIYAYSFQIYFDFAGYSDIAIGVARLFGFRILENFNWPYLQRNIAEFWGHWHISLTKFITGYVFIPLGGSREGRWKTVRNTLIAMALSGLWHGAAWHFVVWGLAHGAALVVARWWREMVGALKRRSSGFARTAATPGGRVFGWVAGWALTFNFVTWAWVLFLLPLSDAAYVYRRVIAWIVGIVLGGG